MPVSRSSALPPFRSTVTGMALAAIVAGAAFVSPSSASAGEQDRWPAGATVLNADDTLFPLGKPPALIEATGPVASNPTLWIDNATLMETDHISTGAILSTRQLAGMSAFSLPGLALPGLALPDLAGRIMPAERHIVIGLMLLAAAGMAGISFGLWRWQVRGLALDA